MQILDGGDDFITLRYRDRSIHDGGRHFINRPGEENANQAGNQETVSENFSDGPFALQHDVVLTSATQNQREDLSDRGKPYDRPVFPQGKEIALRNLSTSRV
jgi:hypothetical protein